MCWSEKEAIRKRIEQIYSPREKSALVQKANHPK